MDKIILENFKNQLNKRELKICVIGLGYIGLPMACEFAKSGHQVLGIDVDPALIAMLNSGKSYIPDIKDPVLAELKSHLNFSVVDRDIEASVKSVKDEIASSDIYIICVPTPLKYIGTAKPEEKYLEEASTIIKHSLVWGENKARLVIYESTTYPGSTESHISKILKGNIQNIENTFFVYSPERANPAGDVNFTDVPKVVGGTNPTATTMARLFYNTIFEREKKPEKEMTVPVSSPAIAETVKCAENGYRLVSISFANELARQARNTSVDAWKLIEKMNEISSNVTLNKIVNGEFNGFAKLHEIDNLDIALKELKSKFNCSVKTPIRDMAHLDKNKLEYLNNNEIDYDSLAKRMLDNFCFLSILYLDEIRNICGKISISYSDTITAILTKPYGLGLCLPGPGAGGHCIPIDPLYLHWLAREKGVDLSLLWEATLINNKVPYRIGRLVSEGIHNLGKVIQGSKILVLGVTYKPNVPDRRESKTIDLIRSLISKGAEVVYCDPEFSKSRINIFRRVKDDLSQRRFYIETVSRPHPDQESAVEKYYLDEITLEKLTDDDVFKNEKIVGVVISTNHKRYMEKGSIYKLLERTPEITIIDTRNVIDIENCINKKNVIGWGKPVS